MYGIKKREGWEVDLDNYLKEQEKADSIMEGLTNEFNSYDFSPYEKLCENIHKDLKDVFKEGIEKEFDEYYKEVNDDSCFDPQKILDNCFQSDYFLDNVENLWVKIILILLNGIIFAVRLIPIYMVILLKILIIYIIVNLKFKRRFKTVFSIDFFYIL